MSKSELAFTWGSLPACSRRRSQDSSAAAWCRRRAHRPVFGPRQLRSVSERLSNPGGIHSRMRSILKRQTKKLRARAFLIHGQIHEHQSGFEKPPFRAEYDRAYAILRRLKIDPHPK